MPRTQKKQIKNVSCATCDTTVRWSDIGGMMIAIISLYIIADYFGIFSFADTTEEIVGLGTIFFIGITASVSSCLAMVGGLLLSVSAKWAESNPNATRLEKLAPLAYFNVGRLAGYFVFGGLTGLIGKSLLLSVQTTGYVKIALSIVMIVLGLNILRLIPKKLCRMPLPQSVQRRIHDLSNSGSSFGAMILGAITFFIPCGFTQSMQLLALGSGSFTAGGLIMVVFALGTLPSLLGISVVSAVLEGKAGKLFITFAGCVSLLLGITNFQSGLLLAGHPLSFPSFHSQASTTADPAVTIDKNGQQVISVAVDERGYSKYLFTIQPNIPTWIYATLENNVSGCLSSIAIPTYNISKSIAKGENWIGPIVPTRDFAFTCSMGMYRADVKVQS